MISFHRFVRIQTASTTFVGFVLVRGSHMVVHGIIAIDMMKMRRELHAMHKKNWDLHWRGIYFIKRKRRQCLTMTFLHRYLHYYNRYMNHMQSLKFEHKLYASVKLKMEEMQQHNMSWIEVRILDFLWQFFNSKSCFRSNSWRRPSIFYVNVVKH